jgi:hypothetical protein
VTGSATIGLCLRPQWRARWRGLLVVALLAGVSVAAALTAFAGARRSVTAFDRLLEETGTPNVGVSVDGAPDPALLERAATVPGVKGIGQAAFMTFAPADDELRPGIDTVAVGLLAESGASIVDPVVEEGRHFAPDRVDEIMLNPAMADLLHAQVGDRLTLVSFTEDAFGQFEETGVAPEPDGPEVEVTVVGIGKVAEDVADAPDPIIEVTPAFVERFSDEVATFTGTIGVIADEERIEEVVDGLRDVYPDAAVGQEQDLERRIEDGIRVQVIALWTFGAVMAAAGLLAGAQALARQVSLLATENPARRALGMTTGQLVAMGTLLAVPAVLAAAALAVGGAIAASPLLPAGLAGQAEVDPGVAVDVPVLAFGALGLVVVVLLAAATSAWRAAVADTGAGAPRPSAASRLAAWAGLRPPPLMGLRNALEPGSGATSVPVRSVLVGVVVGVAGVAAVVTFTAGIRHLFDTPRLWGATHDAVLEAGEDPEALEETVAGLVADEDVDAVAVVSFHEGVPALVRGREVPLNLRAVDTHKGDIRVTVRDGAAPARADEVAIGRSRLHELGLEVGDTLRFRGDGQVVPLRVVGEAVVPDVDEVDSSVVVTRPALERLGLDDATLVEVSVGLAPDADRAAVSERHGGVGFDVERPSIVDNLDELGALPTALVVLLAALAIAAAAHGLASVVRRRRREFAVLRSLGWTRGQVALAVEWQAAVIAGIGVVVGLPAGIVLGRQVYRIVGNNIGVVIEPVVPVLALAVVLCAAVAAVLAVSLVPGWAASRLRPGTVLRAE